MKIKKAKLVMPGLAAIAMVMNMGCDKVQELGLEQEALGCADWAEQTTDELVAYSNALGNYSSDPTPANCNNFRETVKNYYEALESLRECATTAGVNQADFNAAIAEAKKEVDRVDCSG